MAEVDQQSRTWVKIERLDPDPRFFGVRADNYKVHLSDGSVLNISNDRYDEIMYRIAPGTVLDIRTPKAVLDRESLGGIKHLSGISEIAVYNSKLSFCFPLEDSLIEQPDFSDFGPAVG